MPYAYDYSVTYKSLIKAYWEAQIDSGYAGDAGMKVQLNVFLDNISTAETNYKTAENLFQNNYLRYRWMKQFGFLNLAVLYRYCMTFPPSANLPVVPDFFMPWLSDGTVDLRSFSTAWRYTWPGNGTTSSPWFTLSPGAVAEIDYGIGAGEATAMANAFNNHYPIYTARYTNTTTFALGPDNGSGVYASYSDAVPALTDYNKFWLAGGINDDRGIIERVQDFLNSTGGWNYTHPNYKRWTSGLKILNYLASAGTVTMTGKPEEWLLAHGGTELMNYFGWSSVNGSILP